MIEQLENKIEITNIPSCKWIEVNSWKPRPILLFLTNNSLK